MSIIEGKWSFNKKISTRSLAPIEFPFQVYVFTNFKQAHIYIAFVAKEILQGILYGTLLYFLLGVFGEN